MPRMTLEELLHSHKEKPDEPAPARVKAPRVVSPITEEHLGFCDVCGVVSYCLVEGRCPVCEGREGRGVAILRKAMEALGDVNHWLESLGPENSWSVEEYREPLHIKQSSIALKRTMQGLLDRETNGSG